MQPAPPMPTTNPHPPMDKGEPHKCDYCGFDFTSTRWWQKYGSKQCQIDYWKMLRSEASAMAAQRIK